MRLYANMVNIVWSLELLRVRGKRVGDLAVTWVQERGNRQVLCNVRWKVSLFHLSTFRPYLSRIAQRVRKLREVVLLSLFYRREKEGGENSTSSENLCSIYHFREFVKPELNARQLQAIIPQDDNCSLELLLDKRIFSDVVLKVGSQVCCRNYWVMVIWSF